MTDGNFALNIFTIKIESLRIIIPQIRISVQKNAWEENYEHEGPYNFPRAKLSIIDQGIAGKSKDAYI